MQQRSRRKSRRPLELADRGTIDDDDTIRRTPMSFEAGSMLKKYRVGSLIGTASRSVPTEDPRLRDERRRSAGDLDPPDGDREHRENHRADRSHDRGRAVRARRQLHLLLGPEYDAPLLVVAHGHPHLRRQGAAGHRSRPTESGSPEHSSPTRTRSSSSSTRTGAGRRSSRRARSPSSSPTRRGRRRAIGSPW